MSAKLLLPSGHKVATDEAGKSDGGAMSTSPPVADWNDLSCFDDIAERRSEDGWLHVRFADGDEMSFSPTFGLHTIVAAVEAFSAGCAEAERRRLGAKETAKVAAA